MKTLSNSAKRVRKTIVAIPAAFVAFLQVNAVADNATVMNRTRIMSLSATMQAIEADAEPIHNNPIVMVMSKANYLLIPAEATLEDYLALSTIAIAVDVERFVALTPSDDAPIYYATAARGDYDVVIPFTDLERTMCGTDYYIVVAGGAFGGNVRVTVDTDRVELTDNEFKSLFGTC